MNNVNLLHFCLSRRLFNIILVNINTIRLFEAHPDLSTPTLHTK